MACVIGTVTIIKEDEDEPSSRDICWVLDKHGCDLLSRLLEPYSAELVHITIERVREL
jgi:hypothetical protein